LNLLALDTGIKTGWCLIAEAGHIIESGVQDFSKRRGESNGMLFLRFRAWLEEEMLTIHRPALVLYELAHHRGGYATEVCVNLTGRVQEMCVSNGIECAGVHAGTLKKAIIGKGNAGKDEMIAFARGRLNREPIDDNEADAVALAVYGAKLFLGLCQQKKSPCGILTERRLAEDETEMQYPGGRARN